MGKDKKKNVYDKRCKSIRECKQSRVALLKTTIQQCAKWPIVVV